MIYNFDENEMPYGILERFGLTQEMIEDLPTDILQNILNGRHSPVLPVHIIADDGEEVKARTRFCLVRTPESNVDVLFFPKLDEYDLKVFNEQQKQNLLAGKPIIGHLESNETGHELGTKCFFQLDQDSKQVLRVLRCRNYKTEKFSLSLKTMMRFPSVSILIQIRVSVSPQVMNKFGAEKLNGNGTNTTSEFSVVGPWTKMVILTISMRRTTLKKSGMSRRNKVCV